MRLADKVAGPMLARFSAKCPICGLQMRGGWDQVVKLIDLDDDRGTTQHGQGPGRWVHTSCWREMKDES